MSIREAITSPASLEVWFPGQDRYYRDPMSIIEARFPADVAAALADADRALADGASIAGYITYEAGVALESGIPVSPLPDDAALVVLGIFDGPSVGAPPPSGVGATLGPLVTAMSGRRYAQTIDAIRDAIHEGDVYQVNLTVPFSATFTGDPSTLFRTLIGQAAVPHAAFIRHGSRAIVSCSPELFLAFRGTRVFTKPMKGTSSPGAPDELESPKNRAEHVMIVDLMRNDLGRLGRASQTTKLFTVETYPTFATLTSTIETEIDANVGLASVFAATLPIGSITGAPKRAAVAAIAAHEETVRGVAMGTIGFQDGRTGGTWNTAIRTLTIDTDRNLATIRIGGGIVGDSEPTAEWAEILVKRRVFDRVTQPIGIIETLRVTERGELVRLERHLARLERSAFALGVPLKLDDAVEALLRATMVPRSGDGLLRLTIDARGVAVDERPLEPSPQDVTIVIAPQRLNPADPALQHKTTQRGVYNAAFAYAQQRDCFEAALLGTDDYVADGTRTTIFVAHGDLLLTPPLAHGALAGVLREELLASGAAAESPLRSHDLASGSVFIGNSARGLVRARLHELAPSSVGR